MEIKKGIGVSPGVVISTAVVLDAEDLAIPKRFIEADELESEGQRFRESVALSQAELRDLRTAVTARYGKEIGSIFDFHIGILNDPSVVDGVIKEIRANKVTAEFAVSVVLRRY